MIGVSTRGKKGREVGWGKGERKGGLRAFEYGRKRGEGRFPTVRGEKREERTHQKSIHEPKKSSRRGAKKERKDALLRPRDKEASDKTGNVTRLKIRKKKN